ncbi:hypothetical protein [Actinacidiphila bryophytorum]|uniref:hypothetical protein n=1 Tax=Actinacidiphila bryophytorum TaxID=1436133 RepID=UPI002176AAB6|nr:hypothetical protein [Actinacidiphila bryophytorum]UWE13249.1 hypothetical protein NYE86_34310 [Actinacidiphila bryophytorum]
MAELPHHPDTGADPGMPAAGAARPRLRRKARWAAAGAALLVLLATLHLTGVLGAGSHG